jgi:hypothetical protein
MKGIFGACFSPLRLMNLLSRTSSGRNFLTVVTHFGLLLAKIIRYMASFAKNK